MVKNALRQFLTYGLGNILQSALNLILLPLYLRFFTPDEYGVISVLAVLMSLLTLLISGGLMNGLVRLYYEASEAKKKELVFITFLWYLAVGVFGGGILFLHASLVSTLLFKTVAHRHAIEILSVVLIFSGLRGVPLFLLRLEKRAGLYVGFSLFGFLIDFLLKLYFIVSLGRGIVGYFESSAVASLLTLCLMVPSCLKHIEFSADLSSLKELLRLGVPYVVSGFAMWVLSVSDRILLAHFSGESAVGIYSLAYNFANIFGVLLATPIALLIDPFFFAYAAERSNEDTKELLRRSLVYFFIVGGILYLAITLGSRDILRILNIYFGADENYLKSTNLVPILTLAPFFYFLTSQGGLTALLVKRPEITSAVYLIAAGLNFGLNLVILPRLGHLGAALDAVVCYFVFGILVYAWVGRIFPVRYDWKGMIRGVVCMAVALGLGWEIKLGYPILSLLVRVVAGIGMFLVLILFASGMVTMAERKRVFSYLASRRKRFVRIWTGRT